MKPHIKYLLDAEKASSTNLMWGRTSDNLIWVSNEGCNHQEHLDTGVALIMLGCRYDFGNPLECFDKQSGRTITYFKEPKPPYKECLDCGFVARTEATTCPGCYYEKKDQKLTLVE